METQRNFAILVTVLMMAIGVPIYIATIPRAGADFRERRHQESE